jgi:hypothetical protein
MLEKGSQYATKIRRRAFASRLLFLVAFAFIGWQIFVPVQAFAQLADASNNINSVATTAGVNGQTDLLVIIGKIINVVFGLLGVILLVLLIYAGYLWMTSQGDDKKIEEAKKIIKSALIGLVITIASFAIATFILSMLDNVISNNTPGAGERVGAFNFPSAAGSLGGGIIEYHAPPRDAVGIPRNTAIAITFKVPIDPASFIQDWTEDTSSTHTGLNGNVIKIYPTGQPERALASDGARVRYLEDFKTFVIKPVAPLGSPSQNTPYTVELLAGQSGLKLKNGDLAFSGNFSDGYKWNFEVSTVLDLTPPRIDSVVPVLGGLYAPNIVVQINFNEMIDPTSAAGTYKEGRTDGRRNFQNIEVRARPSSSGETGAWSRPNGEYKVSNHFQTVEFITDVPCGVNSCGGTIYCLPFNSSISALVKSATLESPATVPQALLMAGIGYDGIVDLASNSLDGNGNGVGQGPPTDNYSWAFGTNGSVNLTPPHIVTVRPPVQSSRQAVDIRPQADFADVLKASSVVSDNAFIRNNEPPELIDTYWWTPFHTVVTSTVPGMEQFGRVTIEHRPFAPSSTEWIPVYDPTLNSGIQNLYQNCFNPAGSARSDGTAICPARLEPIRLRDGTTRPAAPNCCNDHESETACPAPSPMRTTH